MKKILVFVLMLLSLLFVSCQDDMPEVPGEDQEVLTGAPGKSLILVDPDSSVTFTECKVNSGDRGPFGEPGGDKDKLERAFYISSDEEVLYYPMALVDVYEEYTGERPDSGDPLWTYTRTYFGISLDDVRRNGMGVLLDALRAAEHLPYPTAEDYKKSDNGGSNEEPTDLSDFEPFIGKEYTKLNVDSERDHFDMYIGSLTFSSQLSGNLIADSANYEACWTTFSISGNGKLFYPVILDKVFMEYTGRDMTSGDALFFYVQCYLEDCGFQNNDDLNDETGFEELLNYLIDNKDSLPVPKVSDYISIFGERNF